MATNLASEFFDRIGHGDIEAALALTADTFTWTVAGSVGGPFALAGTYNKATFVRMMGQVAASLPGGPKIEIKSVTADDDHTVIETHVTGTSATEAQYNNNVVYVFDIADGKISAVREYLDTLPAATIFTR